MLKWVLNLIYPPTCLVCKSNQMYTGICGECWNKLHFLSEPACKRCYRQFEYDLGPEAMCVKCSRKRFHVDKVRSPLLYDDASRPLILSFKNANNATVAKVLAKLILSAIDDLLVDCVVPVPLHFYRLVQRGYNQSEMLGKYVAEYGGLELCTSVLVRSRFTTSQSGFSAKGRVKNMRGAFSVQNQDQIRGKSVLLIDDVYTTGATVEECAKVLKQAGAKKVYVATGAMT